MIGVKNNSTERLESKYDGQKYVFEPGVTTAVSEEAAQHIFGYNERDKSRALHRLGWVTHSGQLESGMAKLEQFAFLAVEEVKFKEDSTPLPMRAGIEPTPEGKPLSKEEEEVARTLHMPAGDKKKFGK